MKKAVFVAAVLAAVLLCVSAFAEEQKAAPNSQAQPPAGPGAPAGMKNLTPEERAQLRNKMRERMAAGRPDGALQQKVLADQMAALKQQHQVAKGELESIKQLAVKEKATETTKAIEKLIARDEEKYQKQVKALEQRMERLQAAQKAAEGQKPEPNQPKADPAKQPPKPNATKTK